MRRELEEIQAKFEAAETEEYEKEMDADEKDKNNRLMNGLAGANTIRGVGKEKSEA